MSGRQPRAPGQQAELVAEPGLEAGQGRDPWAAVAVTGVGCWRLNPGRARGERVSSGEGRFGGRFDFGFGAERGRQQRFLRRLQKGQVGCRASPELGGRRAHGTNTSRAPARAMTSSSLETQQSKEDKDPDLKEPK